MISHPAAYFHRGFLRAAKARLWGCAYPYRRAALRRVGLHDDVKARSVRRIAMQDSGEADAAALPTHRLDRCMMLEDQSRDRSSPNAVAPRKIARRSAIPWRTIGQCGAG
jgi:hypothetical protein